ncbi:hypothetical protein V6Z11_D05G111400 [Gossypium hirsutum]
MGGERMAKRSSLGSLMRKRLSDITNTQSQPKPSNQEEKPQQIPPAAEDYINQLIKEKMTLIELVEERNKIIELSGTELQNLRTSLQKLQLQNWNLAQSNSQILAELNLGRDRVKALQHELVCKDALLKAKNLERKGKADINGQNTDHAAEDDDKACTRNRRRNARSQSMGPSTTSRRSGDKEKAENKRRCLRRRTAASSLSMEEACSNPRAENRSSIAARPLPLRKAVEKVQSYKEVPLNIKMRRNE